MWVTGLSTYTLLIPEFRGWLCNWQFHQRHVDGEKSYTCGCWLCGNCAIPGPKLWPEKALLWPSHVLLGQSLAVSLLALDFLCCPMRGSEQMTLSTVLCGGCIFQSGVIALFFCVCMCEDLGLSCLGMTLVLLRAFAIVFPRGAGWKCAESCTCTASVPCD